MAQFKLDGKDVDAVVLVDTDGLPYAAGGGGGGGDTSNIKTNGTTIPTTSALVGGSDGTNIRAFRADTTGRQIVNAQPSPAASVSEGAISITGGASTNAAASNANRMTLTLANPTASIVYWSTGTASASTFPLYPQQIISLTASQIGTGAITVFSDSSVTIRALETSR